MGVESSNLRIGWFLREAVNGDEGFLKQARRKHKNVPESVSFTWWHTHIDQRNFQNEKKNNLA